MYFLLEGIFSEGEMTKGKQAQRHIVVPFLPCDLLMLVRRNDRRRLSVLSNIRRIAPCDVLKAESKRLYPFCPVLSGALHAFAAFAKLAAISKISCVTPGAFPVRTAIVGLFSCSGTTSASHVSIKYC